MSENQEAVFLACSFLKSITALLAEIFKIADGNLHLSVIIPLDTEHNLVSIFAHRYLYGFD
jgi:hypothetical protein